MSASALELELEAEAAQRGSDFSVMPSQAILAAAATPVRTSTASRRESITSTEYGSALLLASLTS
ncbi:hypothetical protein E4U48_007076 [Claviceps purpurea]|nr:hypothetical protein E4U48_007076 [Claviceps purpurea]